MDEKNITQGQGSQESPYKALNDTPMTREELGAIGRPNMRFTPAAFAWLQDDGEGRCYLYNFKLHLGTSFARRLAEEVFPKAFESLGRQLMLAEVQAKVAWLREQQQLEFAEETKRRQSEFDKLAARRKFTDLKDETLPTQIVNDLGQAICDPATGCGKAFKTVVFNAMVGGEKVRIGNFWLVNRGDGRINCVPLCRVCGQDYRRKLPEGASWFFRRSYTYADGILVATEQSEVAKRELERQKRIADAAKKAGTVPNDRFQGRSWSVNDAIAQEAREMENSRNLKQKFQSGERKRKGND
ncbi:MAG: hypothetical protein HYT03_00235 [Candidatus Harrisonbacteria bacterium]|nr:hypothetical protein [Candidatus Harrisonbacteria bacterium]